MAHPKELPIFTTLEFWDRFTYYGIQATFILFLTKALHLTDVHAYMIYGVFTTLGFATPVFGGYLADRFLGFHPAILIGVVFIVTGCLLLSIHTGQLIFLGISFVLIGTGFYKPNTASLLGFFYDHFPNKREAGFTFFYLGMTSGSVAGPFIYGIITSSENWHDAFLISAVGILITTSVYLIKYARWPTALKQLPHVNKNWIKNWKHLATFCITIMMIMTITNVIFLYPSYFYWIIIFGIVALLGYVFHILKSTSSAYRKKIICLLILSAFAVIFFAGETQAGSSLLLFIDRKIHHTLFGWVIPVPFFTALYSFFTVLLAPLVAPLWFYLGKTHQRPILIYRVMAGLLLSALNFSILLFISYNPTYYQVNYPLMGIFFASFTMGLGDLCVTPALVSAVTYLAPKDRNGSLMGVWFLSIAFSGYIGSKMAEIGEHHTTLLIHQTSLIVSSFSLIFFYTALITLIFAIILFSIRRYLIRLIG